MKRIAFFDAKPYDKLWFDKLKEEYGFKIKYYESKLNEDTAAMAAGSDAVVVFVNDEITAKVLDVLEEKGIGIIALRSAGYNNVDFQSAFSRIHVVRVPAYSPYAVAEHAAALLLAINRRIPRAYNRTRDYNFSLNGLTGFDLHGKTMGVIGTGKIGQVFIDICRGFGMRIIAFDPYPISGKGIDYVSLEELFRQSDIISLHCPLTKDTHHVINKQSFALMRDGVYLINTSRGALVDSEALVEAIKSGKVGGAALDVYEEESELFFEDFSSTVIQDDVLARIISMPNVIVTSHQAFLTQEALQNIAQTTLQNLKEYFDGRDLTNEICYQCDKQAACPKKQGERCF